MTEVFDLVIRTPRVIIPGEGEVARSIGVRNGRIAAIEPLQARLAALETWDLETDVVLMPGLVDTHVHVNEPGHTEWEGFRTATTAAAAGRHNDHHGHAAQLDTGDLSTWTRSRSRGGLPRDSATSMSASWAG